MEHFSRDIPVTVLRTITKDSPINPDFWKITGIDTLSPCPETADYSHGIVTIDDPVHGTCLILNRDDGAYFNIIGGKRERKEAPFETFVREMTEETGIVPDKSRVRYAGLIETDHVPSTPLFTYHISSAEGSNGQVITGSLALALLPVSTLLDHVPNSLYNALFAAGS